MRKLFSGMMAAAVLATGMVTFTAPEVSAQGFRDRQIALERYCARNPRDRDCREFRRDERRDDRRYHNRRDRDRPQAHRASRASIARCAARYRSYDPRTHTYVLNSRGDRAVCRL